jgi:hypothetical protein
MLLCVCVLLVQANIMARIMTVFVYIYFKFIELMFQNFIKQLIKRHKVL